jgi:hypothetical protein
MSKSTKSEVGSAEGSGDESSQDSSSQDDSDLMSNASGSTAWGDMLAPVIVDEASGGGEPKRRKTTYHGSQQYHDDAQASMLPIGPINRTQLARMPDRLAKAIWKGPGGYLRQGRALALAEGGFVNHVDFQGRQGWEQGLALMEACFARHGVASGWIVNFRGSEKVDVVRKCAEEGGLQAEHSYKFAEDVHLRDCDVKFLRDGEHQIVEDLRLWKERHPAATLNECIARRLKLKEQFFEEWSLYIERHSESIYASDRFSSSCKLHPDMHCPARWEDTRASTERALTLGSMSPHCQPWCRGGGMLGKSHDGMVPLAVTLGEHAYGCFGLSTMENSGDMPPEVYVGPMRQRHRALWIKSGDNSLGIPLHRYRFFGAGANYEWLVWVGPDGEDQTVPFLQFFERHCVLECDVFANIDTKANIEKTRQAYGRGRLFTDDIPNKAVLSASAGAHLYDYMMLAAQGKKRGGMCGASAADVSQCAIKRNRSGPSLCSLRRSSQLVSLTNVEGHANHFFTPNELSFAHGWPTLEECPSRYQDVLNYDAPSLLSHAQQRSLLGLGLSLNMVQAWYLYLFSHLVRRDYIEGVIVNRRGALVGRLDDDLDSSDGDGDTDHSTGSFEDRWGHLGARLVPVGNGVEAIVADDFSIDANSQGA